MNRFRHLLLLALLGLITACSYNELPENLSPLTIENDGLVLQVETRAETYKGQSLDQEYFVTAADLENFVKYRRSASKRSDLTVKEVKSYGFDSSQTLFYILNYDQGWEVISADKRIQPTLAHGDSGEFTMDSDNEAMKFWMNMLADGVLQMRLGNVESEVATASSESKDSADEPTSDHTAFWDAISPTNSSRTRFEPLVPNPGPIGPIEGIRYSYLVDSEIVSTTTTYYGTQLDTRWGQQAPWNEFCPLKEGSETARAPVGCVAVAGAQMMYYFYHTLGWQLYIPTYVSVTGDTTQHNYNFGSYNYRMFENMSTKEDEVSNSLTTSCSAKLMSYVGHIADMDYTPTGSSASTNDLVNSWSDIYNIECTHVYEYDYYAICDSFIVYNQPLLISGNSENNGHAWVIDQLKRTVETIKYYYATFDTIQLPSYIETLDKEDADRTEIESSITSEVHMNWGAGFVNPSAYYSVFPDNWSFNDIKRIYYNYRKNN